MKQIILEKIYGNIGEGFKEHFISKRLKPLALSKEILPLASYKGKDKRFIYKRINNFSIFLYSVSSEKDDKGRGGNYLSHFIILENIEKLNPTIYIDSKSFISNKEKLLVKKENGKEITLFQKVSYDIEDNFDDIQNNIFNIIQNIIYHVSLKKKVLFYIDNIAEANKLLFYIFNRLPRNITINLSFSINAEKLTKQTICDINILNINITNSISSDIKNSIVDITKLKSSIDSNYTNFLSQANSEETQKFLFFLEQRNFSLETLESASKAYLIDIGKYPIKTEDDILDNIIGIFDETKLNDFLLKYFNKNIEISINTLKKIDNIISEKYGRLTSTIYYKFIVKYSREDYKYFLEKYTHQESIFIYLLCSYNLDEKVFLKELKNHNYSNILKYIIKHDFYKEIFYIQKNKLLLLEKSWHLSSRKIEMEKDIFVEYFSSLSKSKDKMNIFFSELWENSSEKLELTIFIHQKFQKLLNENNLKKLYISINKIISLVDIDNREISTFIKNNNFTQFKGLEKIKLIQIIYFLNNSYICEDNLDKIIEIVN